MSRVWIGARERTEHLQRLAVVFAAPVRLKIVTELYQREMSPKGFYEEFGGRSLSWVAKHFDKLRDAGWLRLVRTVGPGGKRRGGTETIYRATELAICDRETYADLPFSMRLLFSWNTFKDIGANLRSAMEAQTAVAQAGRHLTASRFLVDEVGWEHVVAAVEGEFAAQYEEQEDARRRVEHNGTDLFRVGSLLLSFELLTNAERRVGPKLAEGDRLRVPFPVCVSKVWEDEVCLQIMDEANRGDISVPMFYRKHGAQFDLDESTVRRRFKKLVTYQWLKQVDQRTGGRRNGGVEQVFRATGPAFRDEVESGPWANVPENLARSGVWRRFTQLTEWVKAGIAAGSIARRDETCLAWSVLWLDRQGWESLVRSLEALHAFIVREQELAAVRLRKSGEQPIVIAIGLGAFGACQPPREP